MIFQDDGATFNRVKDLKGVFAFDEFPTYEEMSSFLRDDMDEEKLPFLDRIFVDNTSLTEDQIYWRENGYIIFRNMIPEDLINSYVDLRKKANLGLGAWPDVYFHESFPEIRDLCLYKPLMQRIERMIGYKLAMYFTLSGYTSSERGWHMDDYMTWEKGGASGAASWIALEDTHPDSGPFEFIPGSHRWPLLRRKKVTRYLTSEAFRNRKGKYEYWPQLAEYYVNPACQDYISRRKAVSHKFLAKKGDVLVWHGGLMHRGTHPKVSGLERPCIIPHYFDPVRNPRPMGLGKVVEHTNGEWFVANSLRNRYRLDNGSIVPIDRSIKDKITGWKQVLENLWTTKSILLSRFDI